MEHVTCAVCGSSGSDPLLAKWGLSVVGCRDCGLAFVNPRTFTIEDDSYFRGPYLETIEHEGILRPSVEYLYRRTLDHLETLLEPSHLLDVGCAMGHFMVYARSRGWRVHGVECSEYAGAYGRERWGLPIQSVPDLRQATLPGNYFDACVLIEVVEHLPNPGEILAEVFRLLKPGGAVYLTTPNFASFRARAEGADWNAVVPTGHLYYFTADSLQRLLLKTGFSNIVDLTDAVDFDLEMEAIPGERRPSAAELKRLREKCAIEDAGKVVNGRSEGLVMCAAKPLAWPPVLSARRRWRGPVPPLEGRLVSTSGSSADERKVHYIHGGRRHWVVSTNWLEKRGLALSDTLQVDSSLIQTVLSGPPVG